jgi:nicotinamidase-related amidase
MVDVSSQPGVQNDLHGSAPDTNPAALLLIDVINDFEYPGGDRLYENARHIAAPIRRLKNRAHHARVPVIYVNDNFGRWQSSFEDILDHCLQPQIRGREFVEQLKPCPHDYSVLKPKHSGFYQTPLDILLKHLGSKRLVLAGLCTNSCILATANDAYMRDLELYVPSDCVAAQTAEDQEYSLHHMETMAKADTRPSSELNLSQLTS